LSYDDLILI